MDNSNNRVSTTGKTFEILEALKGREAGRITDLAADLDLNKSVVYNHLMTLRDAGYVVKDGDTYRLGLKFLDFGSSARGVLDVYDVGKPKVNQLADEIGVVSSLMVEERGEGVYLYRTRGGQTIEHQAHAGYRTPLHTTASGKVLLAYMDDERVESIVEERGLPAVTPETITDREELRSELESVRDRGYALAEGENVAGLRAVAAPIQSQGGDVLGAISVSAQANQISDDHFENEIPNVIRNATNAIELDLKSW
ncbi:IclR family transcriptional regulator [Haloarcula salina]|uniref:IclR family transcriptional regulator n=1 Tax=Haloarcula salina TaxID=1429914 RepID=UPI003C702BAC